MICFYLNVKKTYLQKKNLQKKEKNREEILLM